MSSAAAGVSETIKLKDGTRINVKEEILKDGTRRITREIIDVHGDARVETESFREPQEIDDESFLSLEEQRLSTYHRQKHSANAAAHHRHNHGEVETASSSSGWESRMGDLTDDEGPGAYAAPYGGSARRHNGYYSGAETSTQTSGWISSELETKDTSTLNTLSDHYGKGGGNDYDDGFALYTPRKYHTSSAAAAAAATAPRTFEDRRAFHAKRGNDQHGGDMPPLPPRDMKREKNSTSAPPRSPRQQHRYSSQRNSPARSTHKSPRRDYPSISSSSRKSGGSPMHQTKSRSPHSIPSADRFSRHVDNRKSEQMVTAFSRKVLPDEESDLTDVFMGNDDERDSNRAVSAKGGDDSGRKQRSGDKDIKLKRKWCSKWVMIGICVALIGAIVGLVVGWLLPMYSNKATSASTTQGNAASSNQPTSAPTFELLEDDSDSMSSPTANVPETKTPSASPTIDPCSNNICTWNQIGRPLTGDNYGDGAGTSTAISEDGKILAVGGAGSAETGGFAKIFVRRGSSWIQRGQTIEGPNKYDRFGLSMSLSTDGHTVAIGGDGWDGGGVNKGVVRVYKFKRSNSRWEQLGSDLEGDISFDRVGWSVSLSASGRVLAFGAPGSDSGYTRVFHWDGSTWKQRGGDIKLGDRSGHAVDLSADGHVLAVGSADGSYAGVFDWKETEKKWRRRGDVLVGRSRTAFGSTIKISRSGEVVAIAAPQDGSIGSNSGLVKLFYWNGMEWNDLGVIYGSFDSDYAGSAIDLDASGLKIAIGSPGRGVVDIYEWQGGTRWVSQRSFSADVAYAGTENRPVFSVALSSGAKFVAIGSASAGDGGSVTAYQYDIASPSQAVPIQPTASPTSRKVSSPTRPVSSPTRAAPTRQSPTRPLPSPTTPRPTKAPHTPRPSRPPTTRRPTKSPVTARPTKPKPTAKPTRAPTTRAPTPRPTPKPTLMQWNQVGETIFGENSGEYIGTSTSLSARGNTLALGGTWDGYGTGIVRIYARVGSTWKQLGQTLEGFRPGDHFGASVKLSNDGKTLVVGSDLDRDIGSIHVYQYSDVSSQWIQRGDTLEGRSRGDQAGWSVAMSAPGDVIALGAPGSSTGYTRVYEWSGNRWVQRGKDIEDGDRFGHSIGLNGDGRVLAIGALDGSYVKVFHFNGNNWRERGQPIKGDESTYFGASVSLSRSGDVLAVGAPYDTRIRSGSAAGLARVYVWDSGRWVQQGQDLYGAGSFYYFGQSVALSSSGQVLAVGTPGPRWGDVPSSVLVYDWDSSARSWILRGNLISSADSSSYGTSTELPSFSMSMSLNGNTVAIASPLNAENGRASGQVKVFKWPQL